MLVAAGTRIVHDTHDTHATISHADPLQRAIHTPQYNQDTPVSQPASQPATPTDKQSAAQENLSILSYSIHLGAKNTGLYHVIRRLSWVAEMGETCARVCVSVRGPPYCRPKKWGCVQTRGESRFDERVALQLLLSRTHEISLRLDK